MIEYFDPMKIYKNLGGKSWNIPYKNALGQYVFDSRNGTRIIVSSAPYPTYDLEDCIWDENCEWIHASISQKEIPPYRYLVMLHKAVFNDGWAYQIFAPVSRHINIHPKALHLFGKLNGKMIHPDFQKIAGINSI